jgi:hypothetical protein
VSLSSCDVMVVVNMLLRNRWDPATGLGTPNYPKMKELFLSLP